VLEEHPNTTQHPHHEVILAQFAHMAQRPYLRQNRIRDTKPNKLHLGWYLVRHTIWWYSLFSLSNSHTNATHATCSTFQEQICTTITQTRALWSLHLSYTRQ